MEWYASKIKFGLFYGKKNVRNNFLTFQKQFKINYCNFILGNIYGEYDNFKKAESHVIPALIRKFYEAKK